MMKLQSIVLFSILCGLQASAIADGSVEEGQAKSTPCVACHGVNGNSANPEWPNLAGQHRQYIVKQLQAFKGGTRQNPLMAPMAMGVSDDDIEDLAAYFATQTPTGLEADPTRARGSASLSRRRSEHGSGGLHRLSWSRR